MVNHDQSANFPDRFEALLSSIESACDRLSGDIEIDAVRTGNVLTLTFENTHCIVINSQEAMQEIWIAARSGGFHYRRNPATGEWDDTRSGEELRVALARLIEMESGVAPALDL